MGPTSLTEEEGEVVDLSPSKPFVSDQFAGLTSAVELVRRKLETSENVCTLPLDLVSCEVLGPSHAHTVDRGSDT